MVYRDCEENMQQLNELEINKLISDIKTGVISTPSDEQIELLRDYYLNDPKTDPELKEAITAVMRLNSLLSSYS